MRHEIFSFIMSHLAMSQVLRDRAESMGQGEVGAPKGSEQRGHVWVELVWPFLL